MRAAANLVRNAGQVRRVGFHRFDSFRFRMQSPSTVLQMRDPPIRVAALFFGATHLMIGSLIIDTLMIDAEYTCQ